MNPDCDPFRTDIFIPGKDLNLAVDEGTILLGSLPEAPVTAMTLIQAAKLKDWIEARDAKYGDCAAISASQIGMDLRALAFTCPKEERIRVCLNPYITKLEGDPVNDIQVTTVNYPRKYVIVDSISPRCELSFDNETGSPEVYIAEGQTALVLQVLCGYLDGQTYRIVNKDYRTIRNTEKKKQPNARCEGCGKKNKRCTC